MAHRTILDKTGRQRPPRPRGYAGASPVFAAVDLGTNNCRMLAARPVGDSLRVVDSFSRIVRLGENLSATGSLSEAAIGRTIDALKVCAGKMRRLGVRRCRNVATEACRSADNGTDFLALVKAETGLVMEPITAEEEVRLTVAGCAPLLVAELPHVLLFDIGGGSTEIVWAETTPGGMPRVIDFVSIPMGVMTVAERYGQEAMSDADRAAVAATVDAQLLPFAEQNGIFEAIAAGTVQMLGTSGTVTTLGGLHLGIRRYDRAKVDGIFVPFDAIAEMAQRLIALPIAERVELPCVGAQRADLMAAGCSILEAIRGRFPVGKLRVADRGIREGILVEVMTADGAFERP